MKGKLIQLQNSLNTKFKELKAKIEATNTDLKRKIQANDVQLEGKMANITADLQGKIDAGDTEAAEIRKNINSVIPNFNTLADGKYKHHKNIINAWNLSSNCLKVSNTSFLRGPKLTYLLDNQLTIGFYSKT